MQRVLHPSLTRLLRYQSTARFRSLIANFRGSRRMMLSLLALALGVIWLGQASIGLLFRAPASPESLAKWIPMGLMAFACWNVVKIVFRQPMEPFEWSPAERESLTAAPLARVELVKYRLTTVICAAVAKSICFSVIMWIDLTFWIAGMLGMLLALILIDLIRIAAEITLYGLTMRERLMARVVTAGALVAATATVLFSALPLPESASHSSSPQLLQMAKHLLVNSECLSETWFGQLAFAPFQFLAGLVLLERVTPAAVAQFAMAICLIIGGCKAVGELDRWFARRRIALERRGFVATGGAATTADELACRTSRSSKVPPKLKGIGTLAWRQWIGAKKYKSSIAVSLVVPGILSCLTLMTNQSGMVMLSQVVAGLAFYTFLLLPTALRFDFRCDLDRMVNLKSYPITPTSAALGQLSVPVCLASCFQLVVLLVALAIRPYPLGWLLLSMAVLIPTNVLIFSFENLTFLLYPYRQNQEGLGMFIRSILTFTGKSLLFGLALIISLMWLIVASRLSVSLLPSHGLSGAYTVFLVGMWLMLCAAATCTMWFLIRTFSRFDPSCDVPPVS